MKITMYSLKDFVQKKLEYKDFLNKIRMPGNPRIYIIHQLTFNTYYIEIQICDTHIDIENIEERELKEITDILDIYLYDNIKEEVEEIDLDKLFSEDEEEENEDD